MARKSIVFVIVEGPSDDIAIGSCLDRVFNPDTVHVEVMHCDITTERGISSNNAVNKVASIVKKFAENNSYSYIHFQQIIHIVDTDGAFADESLIREAPNVQKVYYSPTEIICKKKESLVDIHHQKAGVVARLSTTPTVWHIPYGVYYMSCNLDHVLYNLQNSSDEEKEENSYRFSLQYKDRPDDFKDFLSNSDFSVKGNYPETWEFIETENHSLQRFTNIALCFPT